MCVFTVANHGPVTAGLSSSISTITPPAMVQQPALLCCIHKDDVSLRFISLDWKGKASPNPSNPHLERSHSTQVSTAWEIAQVGMLCVRHCVHALCRACRHLSIYYYKFRSVFFKPMSSINRIIIRSPCGNARLPGGLSLLLAKKNSRVAGICVHPVCASASSNERSGI